MKLFVYKVKRHQQARNDERNRMGEFYTYHDPETPQLSVFCTNLMALATDLVKYSESVMKDGDEKKKEHNMFTIHYEIPENIEYFTQSNLMGEVPWTFSFLKKLTDDEQNQLENIIIDMMTETAKKNAAAIAKENKK